MLIKINDFKDKDGVMLNSHTHYLLNSLLTRLTLSIIICDEDNKIFFILGEGPTIVHFKGSFNFILSKNTDTLQFKELTDENNRCHVLNLGKYTYNTRRLKHKMIRSRFSNTRYRMLFGNKHLMQSSPNISESTHHVKVLIHLDKCLHNPKVDLSKYNSFGAVLSGFIIPNKIYIGVHSINLDPSDRLIKAGETAWVSLSTSSFVRLEVEQSVDDLIAGRGTRLSNNLISILNYLNTIDIYEIQFISIIQSTAQQEYDIPITYLNDDEDIETEIKQNTVFILKVIYLDKHIIPLIYCNICFYSVVIVVKQIV
jgi:hypothetical protein